MEEKQFNVLVEAINGLTREFSSFRKEVNERFDKVEQRIENVETQVFEIKEDVKMLIKRQYEAVEELKASYDVTVAKLEEELEIIKLDVNLLNIKVAKNSIELSRLGSLEKKGHSV